MLNVAAQRNANLAQHNAGFLAKQSVRASQATCVDHQLTVLFGAFTCVSQSTSNVERNPCLQALFTQSLVFKRLIPVHHCPCWSQPTRLQELVSLAPPALPSEHHQLPCRDLSPPDCATPSSENLCLRPRLRFHCQALFEHGTHECAHRLCPRKLCIQPWAQTSPQFLESGSPVAGLALLLASQAQALMALTPPAQTTPWTILLRS